MIVKIKIMVNNWLMRTHYSYFVYWINLNINSKLKNDFICSQLSPIVILTMPVEIYLYGWQYTMFIPVLILVMLALCYIFLPILYNNKLDNCYTVKNEIISMNRSNLQIMHDLLYTFSL